jgi:hypothetical protein
MSIEEQFRDSLHEQLAPLLAELQPDPGLVDALRARQARRNRLMIAGSAAAVIAIAAGATAWAQSPSGEPHTAVPVTQPVASSSPSPAATAGAVALVSSGQCAGLSVTLAVQVPGWPTWRIVPGESGNAVTVPAGILMYLQANGPCIDALTFHTSGAFAQGPSASGWVSTFNSQGIGVLVSQQTTTGGSQPVSLWLGCAASAGICNGNPQQLAVIDLTVSPVGRIVTPTSPAQGSGAAPGAMVTVPDVIGAIADEATQSLRLAGLAVVSQPQQSAVVPSGHVVDQSPAAGLPEPVGTVVIIGVSSGTSPPFASTPAT